MLGPRPANASMPVNAPKGIGIPFKLKFLRLDWEMEAVSLAILLIFICVLVYLSFNYKNRLTLVFSLYMLGIGVLMFSVLWIFVDKFG